MGIFVMPRGLAGEDDNSNNNNDNNNDKESPRFPTLQLTGAFGPERRLPIPRGAEPRVPSAREIANAKYIVYILNCKPSIKQCDSRNRKL